MYALSHALAACWRWLAEATRQKRHPINHPHRREAKEQ
ncbi:hypothetical protein Q427_04555 [Halomonas sp. BC04]|nr:hypothetical protein Q427_04555 [Halomonas sp. BC04]